MLQVPESSHAADFFRDDARSHPPCPQSLRRWSDRSQFGSSEWWDNSLHGTSVPVMPYRPFGQ